MYSLVVDLLHLLHLQVILGNLADHLVRRTSDVKTHLQTLLLILNDLHLLLHHLKLLLELFVSFILVGVHRGLLVQVIR